MCVSVLVPTRNEEGNIDRCLASVAWSDDIYVIDSNSSDNTTEIARRRGAKVLQFSWDGRGPRKKNWALANVAWKHEWVLIVDADEEVPAGLANETRRTCSNTDKAGFQIRYDYHFLGRSLGHGAPLWKLILVRHAHARYELVNLPDVTGYDIELHEQPILDGAMGRLRERMIHRDNDNLRHFVARHNVYSDWEALLRTKYRGLNGGEITPRHFGNATERRRWLKLAFLASPGRPLLYFLYSYLLRLGFLDGRAGFFYASLMAAYWLQVQAKEYEIRETLSRGGSITALLHTSDK